MPLNIPLIRESFALAVPIVGEVMDKFYEHLFLDYPGVKPLFEQVRMDGQKKALTNSLVFVVEHLDQTEALSEYLRQMGKRHFAYGVKTEHYDMVGASLLKTFAFFFKEKWTPELKNEWTTAYGVIKTFMLEGASYAEPTDTVIKKRARLIGNQLILKAIEMELDKGIEAEIRLKVRKMIFEVMEEEYKNMLKNN